MAGDWHSAAEWAALNLPGVPRTKQGFGKAAANWQPTRLRQGRGGGLEYHVSALPEAARLELGRRAAEAAATTPVLPQIQAAHPLPSRPGVKGTTALTSAGKDRLDAKLAVANAFLAFERAAQGGQSRSALIDVFGGFYNARQIDVPDHVRQALPRVSASSIARYVRSVEQGAAAVLAGAYGNRKGSGTLDRAREDVMGYLAATLCETPNLRSEDLRALLVARFGESVELLDGSYAPMPSLRRVQEVAKIWRRANRQLHLAITNPDAWKNRHMVAVGSYSEGIERPNQLWEIDASPSDVLCTDGRRTIYVVIDVHTRRMMVLVTAVPKSSAVLLLIRRAIVAWGMPEAIKTDNGSDFVSREAERAYALLGCAHPTCTPYSPEQKPHVERAIGTLQHALMPLLPGYTGHNVAMRQALRGQETFAKRLGEDDASVFGVRLTSDELQQLCDAWVASKYHEAPHAGLGDRTPAEVAEAYTGGIAFVTDERALDILLMPAPEGGTRTVGKKGILVENADFWHPALIEYAGTGERFEIRLDPADMGRIFVYRPDPFEFLCIAENPERRGLSRAALAAEAKALQAAWLAEGRAELRRAKRKFRPHDLADTLLGSGRPAEAPMAKVTALPRAALPHHTASSAGLTAASAAIEAAKPALAAPRTDAQQARQAEIARRIEAGPVATVKPEDRWWARAQDIEARIAAGETVADADRDWLEVARGTHWYEARRRDRDRKASFARAVE